MQNNKKKYLGRGIGSVLACIVVSVLLSVGSLYFATDKYGIEMFQSYFENGYIVFLNTLPVFFSIMFVNNPVSVSLLSGDRKPQIRF